MATLKKIPKFVLLIDPHNKAPETINSFCKIKKLSYEYDTDFYFMDRNCNKICNCQEPDMIILIDYVLHFNIGCFKLLRNAEIFFRNEWYDNLIEDALIFYSECEIRNGL